MSDFDLVIAGTVVVPSMIIEGGYVAVRDGKVVQSARARALTRVSGMISAPHSSCPAPSTRKCTR